MGCILWMLTLCLYCEDMGTNGIKWRVVLATCHQVRYILQEQEAIFNKVTSFYVYQNYLHWIHFLKNTCNQVFVWCCKYHKKDSVKGVPINNNHGLLNLHACSFYALWNRDCTQSLVVSCKYWIVPLVSTRVSGYSQVIRAVCTFGMKTRHRVRVVANIMKSEMRA